MRLYRASGHSYLVCPRLIEVDSRFGEHWSKGAPCRHGRPCRRDHDHESQLIAEEGHTVNDFYWVAGCRPPTTAEHPTCDLCGAPLVHADLDDLYDPAHLRVESAGDAVQRVDPTK